MSNSTEYSKKDRERDHAIIVFGLIKSLYNSGKINRSTFNAIKRQFCDDIVNGTLSPAYYEEERARFQKRTAESLKPLSDLEQMFIRVENGELMVTEVCAQLKIGRSTYYRQYRKWKALQTSGQSKADCQEEE